MVDGARFCHKCGRPLFDEPAIEALRVEQAPPADTVELSATAAAPEALSTEISFHNSTAVRVGLMVAGLGIFVINLAPALLPKPLQAIMTLLLSGGSGFFAVWLYMRRTGQSLSIKNGARLGWITGVFASLILMVLFTTLIVTVGFDQVIDALRHEVQTTMPEFAKDSQALGAALLVAMFVSFLTYCVAASLGGAFGAKLLNRDSDAV